MILEGSLVLLIALTILVIEMKDLVHAAIIMAAADMVLVLVFLLLAAPDIAITQAAVGVCASTFILLAAISRTRRAE